MIFERGNGSEKIIDAFAPKLGDLLSRRIVRRCTHKSEKPLVEGETEREGERERAMGEGGGKERSGSGSERRKSEARNEKRKKRGKRALTEL